jgi:tRNA (mo5U34)-methyltransferase
MNRSAAVPVWYHSIDLGEGDISPGSKSLDLLEKEWAAVQPPDLHGKTVLDIGAWDGWFSFRAEQEGAARVVALDYVAWSMDLEAMHSYVEDCLARGVPAQPYETIPAIWRPEDLPGKRGFDLARTALGSRVESVVGDFAAMDIQTLGSFDVVFFGGVLYHLEDPMGGLRRVARLTDEVALIRTVAVAVGGHPDARLWEFYPFSELAGDSSNWFAPTWPAFSGACRAAGFSRVELLVEVPRPEEGIASYLIEAQAWK